MRYVPDMVLNVLLSSDSHSDPIIIDKYYYYPHFQVKKLALRTEKWLAQGHTAKEEQISIFWTQAFQKNKFMLLSVTLYFYTWVAINIMYLCSKSKDF